MSKTSNYSRMTNKNILAGLDLQSLKSNKEFGQGITRLYLGVFATLLIGIGMYNGYYPPNYTEYFIFGAAFLSGHHYERSDPIEQSVDLSR